jgi:mRNA interferase HigB
MPPARIFAGVLANVHTEPISKRDILTVEMHIISRKMLWRFWEQHPDSQTALSRWFKVMNTTHYESFTELRKTFLSADKVGNKIVFNIGGNKYRLIAVIHFNRHKVYVRHVLTHQDYDKGNWK